MSPIGLMLDLFLAALLLSALGMGWRLNKRLTALRDSQAGFAQAAMELNAAITRADRGLTEMRAATHEAEVVLTERVDEARTAAKRLNEAMEKAKHLPVSAPAVSHPVHHEPDAEGRRAEVRGSSIVELLQRARGAERRLDSQPAPEPAEARDAPQPVRSRVRVDEDLFAEEDPLVQLRALRAAGGRR